VTVEALRTPDERFEGLPIPRPRYLDWDGLRLHYTDEGEGAPVVLFHGEPTWGFLYRKVAAELSAAGYRVVVPDLPGFGRSDKPVAADWYTYDRHTDAMRSIIEHLDLREAAAVVQDWGGPIGLRLAVEHPDRFSLLSILNTGLFTGRATMSDGFLQWRAFAETVEVMDIGRLMRNSMARAWPDEVVAGYDAPFPTPAHTMGARRFPLIAPMSDTDPGAAEMRSVLDGLGAWDRPVQVLFSTEDPIFPLRAGEWLVAHIPGAGRLETVERAGHFLQEDAGDEVGAAVTTFLRRTS
jgi:haloalkane dehalogenase